MIYIRDKAALLCIGAAVYVLGCSGGSASSPAADTAPDAPSSSDAAPQLDADTGPPPGPCYGRPDGDPCDDGDACTHGDACSADGVCAGTPIPCGEGTACAGLACAPDTGECAPVPVDDETPCSTPCFEASACYGGECVPDPTTAVVCPEPTDPCVTEILCDAATDACTKEVTVLDGTSCDSDDDCCTLEACQVGVCTFLSNNTCAAERAEYGACWLIACTPETCCSPEFDQGATCDDADPCTEDDTCVAPAIEGACQGTAVVIDDDNPCTVDACDPTDGTITHSPLDDGPCDPPGVCDVGVCDAGACIFECACSVDDDCADLKASACDPDHACSGEDGEPECVPIAGTELTCPPSDEPCTETVCVPASGTCELVEAPLPFELCNGVDDDCDGSTDEEEASNHCSDGNPCNGAEICVEGGSCLPGTAPDCDDGLTCTVDDCTPGFGGGCTNELAAETCLIDGACHDDGASKPDDPCFACVPAEDAEAWTPVPCPPE